MLFNPRCLVVAVTLSMWTFSASLSIASEQDSQDLASTLRTAANEVISHCRENGYKNVGVLKFLVIKKTKHDQDGNGMTATIGTIHQSLARQMEVALLLANDASAPIGIIDDASAIASTLESASFLESKQRSRLFAEMYPLHWGEKTVQPDVMVTGLMQVDSDLRHATLSLMTFAEQRPDLVAFGENRRIKVDASWLSEIGESYSLSRGAFDGGTFKSAGASSSNSSEFPDDLPDDLDPGSMLDQTLTSAVNVRDDSSKHPLNDRDAFVHILIFYDGQPISPSFTDGVAIISEPRAGQEVVIELTKDDSQTRYGVCVKVNGENTLNRTRLPDFHCRKWILSRPGQKLALRGYQINDDELEEFRVLTDIESNQRELDYGKDVGTISVTVFPEKTTGNTESIIDQELDLIASSKVPRQKAKSFAELKLSLLGSANRGIQKPLTRGFIVEGKTAIGRINSKKFSTSRTPIMTATIRYYSR